jgi:hypothetical protein
VTRPALVALLALPLWLGGAAGAEVTLAPGAPLTPDLVAGMVRDDLAGRGLVGDLEVEVRRPGAPVPNEAAGIMRVRLAGLRLDRRTGRFQATLEA